MKKFWVLLFALVPVGAVGLYFWAKSSGLTAVWLPDNISTIGKDIDHLIWLIYGITGVVFLLVNAIFVYVLWKYGAAKPEGKATYTHGNNRLETIWTIIPAAILAFIAFYQFGTWQEAKFRSDAPNNQIHARVLGGQFEWRVRYPWADTPSDKNTPSDELWTGGELEQTNELHVIMGEPTLLRIQSRDVLHSFFIPATRMKQDLMPGMNKQVMWFTLDKAGEYEIACAELCGWGHYKMKGKLIVHETRDDYEDWFEAALAAQRADTTDIPTPE